MDTIKYYSKESLEQLKEELKHLESVERPKMPNMMLQRKPRVCWN